MTRSMVAFVGLPFVRGRLANVARSKRTRVTPPPSGQTRIASLRRIVGGFAKRSGTVALGPDALGRVIVLQDTSGHARRTTR